MNLNIQEGHSTEHVANFIASRILENLKADKKVLFFVTGGSSVPVGAEILKILNSAKIHEAQSFTDLNNLTVTLTDERYGEINHKDSNWQQLLEKGADFSEVKTIPVLRGESFKDTVFNFDKDLEIALADADFKIGLFGIGKDMHTAGILPGSYAVRSTDLVCGYDTPQFSRITITPKTIENLDEAIVFLQGEEKRSVVEHLRESADINTEPAQVLKKVPLLTIFANYDK